MRVGGIMCSTVEGGSEESSCWLMLFAVCGAHDVCLLSMSHLVSVFVCGVCVCVCVCVCMCVCVCACVRACVYWQCGCLCMCWQCG